MRRIGFSRALLIVGFLLSALMLALSWNLLLLELHSFRQTQTAISAYWMASSTNWLAYPTPVLGYPWSVPFEFPLFQAICLWVANLLPISLDQSGRLVSWIFAILTVFPLRRCIADLTGRMTLADTFGALYLISPLYLYGARSFMIESTALFFSVLFLSALLRYWRKPTLGLFLLMLVSALFAALVKITTFFGFGIVGFVFVAWKFFAEPGMRAPAEIARRYLPVAAAVGVAILVTSLYLHYGDVLKARTVWGGSLAASNLPSWTYGTWTQKTSSQLWRDVVFGRASRELLGSALVLPVAFAIVLACGRGLRGAAFCLLAGYLIPFAMFANLHIVHNYYQHANGIFLVGFAACALEALRNRFGPGPATLATAALVVVMLLGFKRDFLQYIIAPTYDQRTVALASFARQQTREDEVLLIFGLDWTSEVPYYATRRAMMVVNSVPPDALRRMRAQPASYTGALRVGLVMVCPNELSTRADTAEEFEKLIAETTAGRKRLRISGCDLYK